MQSVDPQLRETVKNQLLLFFWNLVGRSTEDLVHV